MQKLYRLEYSSPQGVFHLADKGTKSVYGWITLTDSCSDFEYELFELYVRSRFKRQMEDHSFITIVKVTNAQMVEAFRTWSTMMGLLVDNNIVLTQTNKP